MTTRTRENEDLPILDEIGRDLSAAYAREEQAAQRRRPSRRMRRIALATAALFVIGPGSVVATRYIWAPDPGVNAPGTPFAGSKPIQIGEGHGDYLSWRISAYMSDNGLCTQVAVFTTEESHGRGISCEGSAPAARFAPSSTHAEEETLYVGRARPGAVRIEVIDGRGNRLPARIVTPPPDRLVRAKLPKDLRFYVATGPPDRDFATGPPTVVAFDASGREIDRFPPPRR